MVARSHRGDARADRLDNAPGLVAEDRWEDALGIGTLERV